MLFKRRPFFRVRQPALASMQPDILQTRIVIEVCVDSVQSALKLVLSLLAVRAVPNHLDIFSVPFMRVQIELNSAETLALEVEPHPVSGF